MLSGRNLRPARLATDSGGTYRPQHTAIVAGAGLQLTFSNWYIGTGTGEQPGPNSYTIHHCWIEHAGQLTPVLFAGGATSVSVPVGADVQGTADVTIGAGETFWVRSYVTPDVPGGSYPVLYAVPDYPGELSAKGADHAAELGTDNLVNFGDVFGPTLVTAPDAEAPRFAVTAIGDSLANGANDSFGGPLEVGYLTRALVPARPVLVLAVSGEQAAEYLADSTRRSSFVGPGAHYLICTYGLNDLQGGRSLAQVQDALLGIWAGAVERNPEVRVLQTTITPKSSSVNGWADPEGQTADFTVEADRPDLNDWIRAGAPTDGMTAGDPGHPLFGYLEVADLAEPTRNAGIWRPGYTNDGVHPNTTGHLALMAAVDLGVLADVPVPVTPVVARNVTVTSALSPTRWSAHLEGASR
jgi:lysophospholipase L1-like esterase